MADNSETSLNGLLYSHIHGWAPVGLMEKYLRDNGVKITPLKRHNRTDGEYNKKFGIKGKSFELHANQWDAKSFKPLLKWWAELCLKEENNG